MFHFNKLYRILNTLTDRLNNVALRNFKLYCQIISNDIECLMITGVESYSTNSGIVLKVMTFNNVNIKHVTNKYMASRTS